MKKERRKRFGFLLFFCTFATLMNGIVRILLLTLFFIHVFVFHSYSESDPEYRLRELLELNNKDMIYNERLTVDTVISWGTRLEPYLKENRRYDELFEIKRMLILSYVAHADIGLAMDRVGAMYDEARKSGSELGLVQACRTIGDTYTHMGMYEKSLEPYKEAYSHVVNIENTLAIRRSILFGLLHSSLKLFKMEEAGEYLNLLDEVYNKSEKNEINFILNCFSHTYYDIRTGNVAGAKLHLDSAAVEAQKINDVYLKLELDIFWTFYYQMSGEYDKGLAMCDRIIEIVKDSRDWHTNIRMLTMKANMLECVGNKADACRLYQQMNVIKDSMSIKSYVRQISTLRSSYQIDGAEIKSRQRLNMVMAYFIVLLVCSITFIVWLIIRFRYETMKLKHSEAVLHEAQSKAEHSIYMKSVFFSNMTHEIRTPLTAIVGFSSLLTSEMDLDDDTRRQCGEVIGFNSELLLKLINDVIDFSNLEENEIDFRFRPHDAVVICRNVLDTVEHVKKSSALLEFSTSLNTLMLDTDDTRLQQILINLLINATKFTKEGTITLGLEVVNGSEALFWVADTGCGIPPEKQKQIFERFEKLDEYIQGTGLGLSICQSIVKRVGGRIWIDSTYTKGAKFVFTHPITQQPKA